MTAQHLEWRRPGQCNRAACLEVAADGDEVLIRDTKAPSATVQRYTREEFAAFIAAAKMGYYDDLV